MSSRRRFPRLLVGFAAIAVITVLASACGADDKAGGKSKKTTTTASTTTTTSTTTVPPGTPIIAPLTGMVADAATAARLGRPALAVKIDNSVDAMPQEGLNDAD